LWQTYGELIAAPLNGKRRQHGATLFLDTTTLEPYEDQWACLSSLDRLPEREVRDHISRLPSRSSCAWWSNHPNG
jgi:hypothetical protein